MKEWNPEEFNRLRGWAIALGASLRITNSCYILTYIGEEIPCASLFAVEFQLEAIASTDGGVA